jgi:hypothetical protein
MHKTVDDLRNSVATFFGYGFPRTVSMLLRVRNGRDPYFSEAVEIYLASSRNVMRALSVQKMGHL